MKKLFVIFIFLFVFNLVNTKSQTDKRTDGNAIKATIIEIASDKYKGRKTGTPEGVMTEEYFASAFKNLGLKPAGENGTYFHKFEYSEYEPEQAELTIDGRPYIQGWDLDFEMMYYSDGGEAEGDIVFAGYGIKNSELGRNDFDSINIKDKIVLIRRGCPGDDYDKWGVSAIDSVKALYCSENGAKAVLFFNPVNYNTKQLIINNNWIASKNVIKGFPILLVKDFVAKIILSSTKLSYYRMMNSVDYKNVSFETGKKAQIKAKVSNQKGYARNVLAMLPGSDPKLKKEYIIIGGHMDHVGVNASNQIRNGADDNASGVAVTLGIATALVKNKFKPKRTIVFACWTGEEMGLLGSEAWCEKPSLDLYKTVVYFNLDMVGLGDGKLDMPGTLYAPEITQFLKENSDTAVLNKINWSDGGLGGSDHNPFLQKGIPAFAGMTSGDHPDYHRPEDDADKINAAILQFVADFIYHAAEKISQSKINFISETRFMENKALLKKERCFTPIPSDNFVSLIKQNKPVIAVIEFKAKTGNLNQNLVQILEEFDNATKLASNSKELEFKSTALDIISGSWRGNYSALVAAVNLNSIKYNKLFLSVLAKYGFRLGIVDEDFAEIQDTITRKEFIETANKLQVGLVIRNRNLENIKYILENSACPVMILTPPQVNNDEKILDIIKKKQHLVMIQIDETTDKDELIKTIQFVESKINPESIALTSNGAEKSSKAYKLMITKLENELGKNKIYNLTYGNLSKFMVKSLQEYPVKMMWR